VSGEASLRAMRGTRSVRDGRSHAERGNERSPRVVQGTRSVQGVRSHAERGNEGGHYFLSVFSSVAAASLRRKERTFSWTIAGIFCLTRFTPSNQA
jgi:hypothetical protein